MTVKLNPYYILSRSGDPWSLEVTQGEGVTAPCASWNSSEEAQSTLRDQLNHAFEQGVLAAQRDMCASLGLKK